MAFFRSRRKARRLHRAELVDGEFFITVYAHDIETRDGTLPCWTYVSEGLARHGQQEIVFTLRRSSRSDEAKFPAELFEIFKAFHSLVEKGELVTAGGYSVWPQDARILGHEGRWGLLYLPAANFEGIEIPSRALTALLIRDDETEIVRYALFYRLAISLAAEYRFYPYAPWSDFDRSPVITLAQFEKSILSRVRLLRIPGITVRAPYYEEALSSKRGTHRKEFQTRFGDEIVLRVSPEALPELRKYLPDLSAGNPVALLTDPDLTAGSRLYWTPDSGKTVGISPFGGPGRWTTGCFIILGHGEGLADRGVVIEDGFSMILCPDSWKKLEDSIARGVPERIAAAGDGLSLATEFLPAAEPGRERICRETEIVLFNPEDEMRERGIDAASLSEYVDRLLNAASIALADESGEDARGLVVAVGVKPGGKAKTWCEAVGGSLPVVFLNYLERELDKVRPVDVTDGPIAFMLRLALWDRTPTGFPELPEKWRRAMEEEGKLFRISDGLFKLIWPD